MLIYKLTVKEEKETVEYFVHEADAMQTYRTTYSKIENKPAFTIEKIQVLDRATHL